MKFTKLSGIAILSVALLASCGNNCEHEHYLKVAGDPTTTYESGDHFSTDGLQVYLCCDKCGQEKELKKYDVNEHDDYLKTKTKFVTIEYGDLTYNIDVEVTFDYTFTGTITCVGDSLTEGHNWPTQSYPTYINENLPAGSNAKVINCGKNGASFKTFGQYNPAYNTTTQYTNSLKEKPDIVTILLGTNDATNWANEKDDFYQDYVDLIHLYQTHWGTDEQPQIILLTSPTTKESNSFGIPNEVIRDSVNPIQRQVAEELDLPLIDLRKIFDNYEGGLDALVRPNDGVHFSVEAAKLVAGLIADEIVYLAE